MTQSVAALPEVGQRFSLEVDGKSRTFMLLRAGYCRKDDSGEPLNQVLTRLLEIMPDHKAPEPDVLKVFRRTYPNHDSVGPIAVPDPWAVQKGVPLFGGILLPVVSCLKPDDEDGRWNPDTSFADSAFPNYWRWLVEVK